MNRRNRFCRALLPLALCALFFHGAHAQQPIPVPRDSAAIVIAGKRISVDYGRPSMLGRKIMGDYVRYNRVWRTGSGKSTTLVTESGLELGGLEIPMGSYSLWTLPSEGQWKLIINKEVGQWGTVYNPQRDLARINLQKKKLAKPVEKLTLLLERGSNSSGMLRIEWEYTSLSVPFKASSIPIIATPSPRDSAKRLLGSQRIPGDYIDVSPRDSVTLVLGGKKIVLDYGRPSVRGRKIVGGLVPYNKVWRTGANEATRFTTEADLEVGGMVIPKGSYTLFTLPSKSQWKMIINKQTGQWGTEYDPRQDFGRINIENKQLSAPVEKLTLTLEQRTTSSGLLKIEWEKTSLSIPITLKSN
jgi:hypothetical protein